MKIRSRIAGGVSTLLTRYVLATRRRRLIASWVAAARCGQAAPTSRSPRGCSDVSPYPDQVRRAHRAAPDVDATAVNGIFHARQTRKSPFHQHVSDKEGLVRSSLDHQAQAFLSDQRQQLADVTTMAGLDTWRDHLVAANRQRGGALACVLATMVSQLADHDEHNRAQVAGYFAEWRRLIATTLRRMQTGGQLRSDAAPDELATGLIAALQGGYVLTEASRNVDDMATASEMALARIRFFADHR
jgi:TetR/AcrR family transcriptional repressor of nem operon